MGINFNLNEHNKKYADIFKDKSLSDFANEKQKEEVKYEETPCNNCQGCGCPTCNGYGFQVNTEIKTSEEILIKELVMIDKILLNKAKELNLHVDFSDKEYDGDKEAPMDRIGFMGYILEQHNAVGNVWINIKEDWMPDKDTWVLVCTYDDNIFVSYYDSDFEQIIENKGITHWMPLPASPESQPKQKEVEEYEDEMPPL